MKKIVITLTAAALLLSACQSNNRAGNEKGLPGTQNTATYTDVPYRVAKNYFVRNDAPVLTNPKITTIGQFNEFFGMARTMAEDSKPAVIDFDKEFVLAVILPETDTATSLQVQSVQKDDRDKIILHYKLVRGERQTFTSIPFLALIVEKADYTGFVIQEER